MARPSNLVNCSFCGKSHADPSVRKLIAGDGVYICDSCINVCNSILDGELGKDAQRAAAILAPKLADVRRTLERYVTGVYRACLERIHRTCLKRLPSGASFTFRHDKKYQFEIDLDFAQRMLRNTTIAKSFYALGFIDVSVVGTGSKRVVHVGWLHDDATVTVEMIPGEINRSGPGFALAELLEGIGQAEELQQPKQIP